MSSSTSTPALPASGGEAESKPAQSGQSSTAPLRAIIKHSDMDEETQQDVVDLASEALEKYNIEKDIAMHIKKEADRRFGTTWHCVVGKNFGSFVTHETRYFIYFYLGQIAILLWKSS